MRMIKFRAKRLDNDKWIYGDLHLHTPFPHIHSTLGDKAKIDTDTIGQFTGLHDKNGKEIYEGDIVKRERKSLRVRGFPEKTYSAVGYIGFKQNDGRYVMVTSNSECSLCEPYAVQMEVIGNIHDNPELLKSL